MSYKKLLYLVLVTGLVAFVSGCIRLWGRAAYVKEAPREHTERVAGFDTAKMFEAKQAKGSITV